MWLSERNSPCRILTPYAELILLLGRFPTITSQQRTNPPLFWRKHAMAELTITGVNLVLGISGSLASLISLWIAAVQTMRYREAKVYIRYLERLRNATIWSNIAMVLQTYE